MVSKKFSPELCQSQTETLNRGCCVSVLQNVLKLNTGTKRKLVSSFSWADQGFRVLLQIFSRTKQPHNNECLITVRFSLLVV